MTRHHQTARKNMGFLGIKTIMCLVNRSSQVILTEMGRGSNIYQEPVMCSSARHSIYIDPFRNQQHSRQQAHFDDVETEAQEGDMLNVIRQSPVWLDMITSLCDPNVRLFSACQAASGALLFGFLYKAAPLVLNLHILLKINKEKTQQPNNQRDEQLGQALWKRGQPDG